eukprot:CAMPEP_0170307648 /NCGR_PEP_ID=MMETSP0116_2-20130129/54248_1 /TAXON_ID=400756 /ORGANISM="Durinskia baltica, Strain CSIRO CS-38" /LENGTH=183 /DNA_ID=CAMNT_0010559799 /DNA_START=136 /DNA_END=684 /DNA_ORIENTATION=-
MHIEARGAADDVVNCVLPVTLRARSEAERVDEGGDTDAALRDGGGDDRHAHEGDEDEQAWQERRECRRMGAETQDIDHEKWHPNARRSDEAHERKLDTARCAAEHRLKQVPLVAGLREYEAASDLAAEHVDDDGQGPAHVHDAEDDAHGHAAEDVGRDAVGDGVPVDVSVGEQAPRAGDRGAE